MPAVIRLIAVAMLVAAPCLDLPAQTTLSAPWDMNELRQPPQVQWLDESGPVQSLLYSGQAFAGHPTQVFAYFASPRTLAASQASAKSGTTTADNPTGKFPAVVLVHGGGGTAFREWTELWAKRGYAAIAMDLAGQRPIEGENAHQSENRRPLTEGGPGQGDDEKFGSIDKPASEQWPYHAVANVILAHSLIRSFEDVDTERTAVTGISWGGYLTCIVAGMDPRFKAAVPVYGCGFLYENSAWLSRFGQMSPSQRQRWIDLWDPSRYLPQVSMPILFVNGTNDFAYPLDSYMKSYAAVPAGDQVTKQLCITVNMPHGHPAGWARHEIGWFIDHWLLDAPPLCEVGEPEVHADQVTLQVTGQQPAVSAELHYTTDVHELNKRSWHTTAAEVAGAQISAAVPPSQTTAWFLTVTDHRGGVVSTQIQFAD